MIPDICIEYTPAFQALYGEHYWSKYAALMERCKELYGPYIKVVYGLDGFYLADFVVPRMPCRIGPCRDDRLAAIQAYIDYRGALQ